MWVTDSDFKRHKRGFKCVCHSVLILHQKAPQGRIDCGPSLQGDVFPCEKGIPFYDFSLFWCRTWTSKSSFSITQHRFYEKLLEPVEITVNQPHQTTCLYWSIRNTHLFFVFPFDASPNWDKNYFNVVFCFLQNVVPKFTFLFSLDVMVLIW